MPCLSLILIPTEKPGYFGFIVTGEDLDMAKLLVDEEGLRRVFRQRVERQDLAFGELEAVSSFR